jgi:hypothetical protein
MTPNGLDGDETGKRRIREWHLGWKCLRAHRHNHSGAAREISGTGAPVIEHASGGMYHSASRVEPWSLDFTPEFGGEFFLSPKGKGLVYEGKKHLFF